MVNIMNGESAGKLLSKVWWWTGSSIPLIIIISWICSITFFCDLKCFIFIFT
jgi:hypothetical protein